jgi:hypothetical protein
MSITVTGATGQLGRLTVESLLRRGVPPDQIVAVGRNVAKAVPPASVQPPDAGRDLHTCRPNPAANDWPSVRWLGGRSWWSGMPEVASVKLSCVNIRRGNCQRAMRKSD